MSGESFAAQLREAEDRLRALGLSGRAAYAALCRHLARRLNLPQHLWLEGPDAPAAAGLERIPLTAELDLFGLAYERFFPEVFKAERGQFFTPRPLVELMVDLVELRPGERVIDPTCGSGSFLIAALGRGAEVDGLELDPELVALCRLNLALSGANPRAVVHADLFREPVEDTWDVILANPPFSVDITEPSVLAGFELAAGRARASSDLLFVEAAWRRLRPGGRMAVVLPHSVLANNRYAPLRAWMAERFVRRAIVSLPEGVFRPFGGAASRAAVVVLQRRPAELRPWIVARVEQPGFDPRSKVYRRTEQDDLGLLRIQLRDGLLRTAAALQPSWEPDALLVETGLGAAVPTVSLGALAEIQHQAAQPADQPEARFTRVDLADIDKATGEVSSAEALHGRDFNGPKAIFQEGDLLFARIRPELNNVCIASRPDPALPAQMCGSSEWVRLIPRGTPYFTLLAARSPFVRAQLRATGGQTRPRVNTSDLPDIAVPDPGQAARLEIDRLLAEAHAIRREARRRMNRLEALYLAYGRGDLDAEGLAAALAALPPLAPRRAAGHGSGSADGPQQPLPFERS